MGSARYLLASVFFLAGCSGEFYRTKPCSEFFDNTGRLKNQPVFIAGSDCFADGITLNNIHTLGRRVFGEYDAVSGVSINSIDGWRRNVRNILQEKARWAEFGIKPEIILIAYSMGAKESLYTQQELDDHGIPIKLMALYDPTCTNNGPMIIGDNVEHIMAFFSTNEGDAMWWARGKAENIRSSRTTPVIRRMPGSHGTFVNQSNTRILEDFIEECGNGNF